MTIVSAFPGVGKSTLCRDVEKLTKDYHSPFTMKQDPIPLPDSISLVEGLTDYVFDSDSSKFPKDGFPDNYVAHLIQLRAMYVRSTVLISTHAAVQDALYPSGVLKNTFSVLVIPHDELKDEYLKRYAERGSPEAFIKLMNEKWDDFIDSCLSRQHMFSLTVTLSEGRYLSDISSLILPDSID